MDYTIKDWHRFLSFVEPVALTEDNKAKDLIQGCWHWVGAISDTGYGTFTGPDGRTKGAHREAYKFCWGPIPRGHVLMHICDNPQCVNPWHHTTGTSKDNMLDMVNKGRGRNQHSSGKAGENNSQASFTEPEVRRIKLEYAHGTSPERLAKKYKRALTTIKDICYGKTWQHVEVKVKRSKQRNDRSRRTRKSNRTSTSKSARKRRR